MRLVKITVAAFQCIEHAEVELGPGLNVLYGPNDLGKSSLAAAIRNVLLLPHASTAHEQLVSWHSGDAPRVALTFSTEAQRLWRVTKTFGAGGAGSSSLEFSKDGNSFSIDATGREVDGRIRELLRWGISPPGGRNAARGIPDSFLTNVLLAEQIDVPHILARGLTGDPDESGRARLNEALQALAQDPLFKRILDDANGHIGRAFTSTGLKSKRQGSPFQDVREEINELRHQLEALQTKLNETLSAEATLQQLHGQLDALAAESAEADEALASVRQAHAQTQGRAAVEQELGAAHAALAAVRAELAEVDTAAQTLATLQGELGVGEVAAAEKEKATNHAALARDAASQRLQEARSESGAQARQIALHQLENDRLRTEGRRTELLAVVEAAAEAGRRSEAADGASQALELLREQLRQGELAVVSCGEVEASARDQVQQHKHLEALGRLREARRTLQRAQEAETSAKAAREAAAAQHHEAERIERAVAESTVPGADVVRAVRTLAQELEVAEARLGGGLSVALTPQRDIRLQVAFDGGEPEEHQGRASLSLEAQRSLELRVDDILHITVTAGEVAAREQVEGLRARWAAEGAPILTRAAVPTIAALEEARRGVDDLLQQLAARHAEAKALEQTAQQHEQRATGIDALRRLVVEREQAVAGCEPTERVGRPRSQGWAAELEALGDGWESELERLRVAAEAQAGAAAGELAEARSRVTEVKTQLAEREAAYQTIKEGADQALAPFPGGVQGVLEQGRGRLEDIERAIADLAQQAGGLSQQAENEESEAQRILDVAVQQLEAAVEAQQHSQAERDEKRDAVARASGVLDARRAQAERLDLEAADNRVDDIANRLAGMPTPQAPASKDDVDAADVGVKTARRAVADKQGEIHHAQGGLEQVGGAVVREQQEELDRALQIAIEREHRVEVEYEAWKLLAETLREVENSEGAHLGKALAGPLSERFSALTAGRYGRLAIGQQLEAEGIEAGGQLRPFDALSVGTQEQLATLFRLSIAEQLSSAVVLDDHLSQSDAGKIAWFRELLRHTGQNIQVVLLTCRPGDYLLPDEFPGGEDAIRDRAAGSLRAVNLARLIHRYPVAAPTEQSEGG